MTASDIVNEERIKLEDVCPIETVAGFKHDTNAMILLLSHWLEHSEAIRDPLVVFGARDIRRQLVSIEGELGRLLDSLMEELLERATSRPALSGV